MKIKANLVIGAACASLLWITISASADTLQMKDGRVIQGQFLGGTQASVQFESNGKIKLYNVSDVISVTFTGVPAAAGPVAPPPASVPPEPAVPNQPETPPVAVADQNSSATVPAGTDLLVRMIDSVDSDKNHVGDRFRASLEQDLNVDGVLIATKGTDVYGRLAEAQQAGQFTGKSQLKLELTEILIQGHLQPITTGEYELSGASRGADTAKKVGVGALAGTVIGAIAGGGKGAAIGAGVGAGAGAAVQVATKGEQVHVPSETLLDFKLSQPFSVPASGQ